MSEQAVNLELIVAEILQREGDVRLVAVDGPGGSGKTTFATELSACANGAPIVHTDDFASPSNPIDWWPRLLEQVVVPLAEGRRARYQRYDWPSGALAEWHAIDPAPIVIIEGVSAARQEWAEHLRFLIWIETPRDIRLERGLERDGSDAAEQWGQWMAAEDDHYNRDPTKERADLIINGTPRHSGSAPT